MKTLSLSFFLAELIALIIGVASPLSDPPPMPSKILMGYASHNYTNVIDTVMQDGVNVVVWAFADIRSVDDESEQSFLSIQRDLSAAHPSVVTNLNLTAVSSTIQYLKNNGHAIHHLVSLGGWNGRHLDTTVTPTQWMDVWYRSGLSSIFHGIDWDLEGNDDLTSRFNLFTMDCLKMMGEISRLMKQDGHIVTMAPPQSYLDIQSPNFSRYVNLTVPTRSWHPEFHYFGSNVYAYILSHYSSYIDLVSIQLYESYTNAALAVYHDKASPQDYLVQYIQGLAAQEFRFYVDFSQDISVELHGQYIPLPLDKLVIGLRNGWVLDNDKQYYMSAEQCQDAYKRLITHNLAPRGFMFWTIERRGYNGVYLAKALGEMLFGNDTL